MPIYPYGCSECGHEFELLQKISDDPVTHCPNCGAEGVRRLLTAPVFRLKGTGWYETDFKNKDRKTDKKDAKGDGKDGKDAKDGKNETKAGQSKDGESGKTTNEKTGKSESKTSSKSAD